MIRNLVAGSLGLVAGAVVIAARNPVPMTTSRTPFTVGMSKRRDR
jgi:hypothetical protein